MKFFILIIINNNQYHQQQLTMISKSSFRRSPLKGTSKFNSSCFSFQSIIRDSVHRSISGRKQATTNLQLSKMPHLSPDSLKDIIRNFPHVKHLDLSGCYQINKQSIEVIARELSESNLTSLNLEFCHYVTDEDLTLLFGNFDKNDGPRRGKQDLVSLNLSYTNISDLGIRVISMSCPNLKILKLNGMKNITDLSLSMIAKYCGQLSLLDIQDCANISDYGVSIISQECKNLENLNLNGCQNVSNNIVSYLCYYNRSLKILDLRNTRVTGDAIVYILANLVELENLKISGLPIRNENTYAMLLLNLKSLKSLDISFCYGISKDFISELIRSYSSLEEIHLFGLITNEEKQSLLNINNRISIYC